MEDKNKTLYDLALQSVLENEDMIEVRQLIESSEDSTNKNDLVYGLFLHLQIIQKSLEFQHQMQGVRHKAVIKEVNDAIVKNINQDQVAQKVQFRRLAATLNERRSVKIIFLVLIIVLGIVAGIGTFGICSFWVKKPSRENQARYNYQDFLKIHKELSNVKK